MSEMGGMASKALRRAVARAGACTVWFDPSAKAALETAGRRVAVELGLDDEGEDDAGLKRLLSAEAEACEMAGL